MEIELDCSKTARQNLSLLYSQIAQLKKKKAGAQAALHATLGEIEKEKAKSQKSGTNCQLEKENANSQKSGATSSQFQGGKTSILGSNAKFGKNKNSKIKTGWWSQFRPFETSSKFLAVAGKNAKQNDELYAQHLEEGDLFFHADIQGAPTVILKNGKNAPDADLQQTAQWAASFSSAWKTGAASVDVYCIEKSQVSKHAQGGYVGRGAFAIEGKRQWFRGMALKLKIGKNENGEIGILPFLHPQNFAKQAIILPGRDEKEHVAKELSAFLGAKADGILPLLPNGGFSIIL